MRKAKKGYPFPRAECPCEAMGVVSAPHPRYYPECPGCGNPKDALVTPAPLPVALVETVRVAVNRILRDGHSPHHQHLSDLIKNAG